ncbi:MAG TPA: bifunctional 4-hydroxy-2-oxoglutarate aldolase/2-dehydro-3-deoxy-phosphogluconate aldolase [Gaiellaceae bacterium]|nr:bifunctional 4-hydroxy-2-oxoglutarate aldolase/2-dehydro-3-deoxy-phosphogluconate aldolase [Gaiellaceae bacterium]
MTEVIERLAALRVVPVLTATDADEAERACEALLAGGLSAVEVTFRTDAAADAIRRVAQIDGLVVGAGTILSTAQLAQALDAGASFAVAPGTNASVVEAARATGVPFFPGVATPSEIERARELGRRVLKVFPASILGGPPLLKALAAVYRDVRFVPTGGISAENLASYLDVPAVLACGGTWICEQSLLREGRFDEVARRAREAVALVAPVAAA